MTTFDTPSPISVRLDFGAAAANVRLIATDRADTVVEVAPSDPDRSLDVKAAAAAEVTLTGRDLVVVGTRQANWFGHDGAVDLTIELPTGSKVVADCAHGGFHTEGLLGECRLTTHYGNVDLEQTGPLHVSTGAGWVRVDHVDGDAEVTSAIGAVGLGVVVGDATVTSKNDTATIAQITGTLKVTAKSDITVGIAHADVVAKSSLGDIRIGEADRGSITMETADGELEIGIRDGIAVWYDAATNVGTVNNALTGIDGPEKSEGTVEVRARTHRGDILIRRADLEGDRR